jgi:hypothetical protein
MPNRNMRPKPRRLVTGNDAAGRSVVIDDSEIAETGGAGNFNFWMTGPGDIAPMLPASFPFFPRSGETIFRVFRIPQSDTAMTASDIDKLAAGFFAELGDPGCKVDTSRHPLMHATPTVDYIMLLAGEAALLLDEGEPIPLQPFDAVVQRGTNHAWLNTGPDDAVFLAVMLGAEAAGRR